MKDLITLLSSFIPHLFLGRQTVSYSRLIMNILASFFLIAGSGLSCVALYHYLTFYWGETFSLWGLCIIFFILGFILYGVGCFLKPKKNPSSEIMLKLEETLDQFPSYDLIKKVCSVIPPKALVGLFATVAIITYVTRSDKKDG
jgi:hypothetical protein